MTQPQVGSVLRAPFDFLPAPRPVSCAKAQRTLTTTLALLLSSDLHLGLVEVKVGLHLLDGLVRDGEAKLLQGCQKL
jgi:hypothetical protein